MSLRKSPELTPKLLAANRRNARLSTGPRTPAAKENSKMNALKHGRYAAPENRHRVMLILAQNAEIKKKILEIDIERQAQPNEGGVGASKNERTMHECL